MGSLFQGHAIGGIIVAIFNIISIASTDHKNKASPSESAFFCFLAAAIFIVVDTAALIAMTRTSFYKVIFEPVNTIIVYKWPTFDHFQNKIFAFFL